jgi:uroporphyrinogen decarboxylase
MSEASDMTPRQRILTVLGHGQPDRVPIFDFIYSKRLFKEVIGRVPETYDAEDVLECSRRIGYDMAPVPFGGVAGFVIPGSDTYKDEWGTTYRKDPHSWPINAPVAFPLETRSDWKNYKVPDPTEPARLNQVKIAIKLAQESKMAVAGIVRGPFSATWLLFGFQIFSTLLYDDPQFIDEVLTAITDFFIEGGRRMIEAGVDTLFFADDYGSSVSPLISPLHFNKHVLPQVRRMVKVFHELGSPVIMHSDGQIRPLLDGLVQAGIDAYHPIERQADMDIGEIKQSFGNRLCLLGNVGNTTTLVTGSPQDVTAEALECLRSAAPGGAYILASDHSIKDDVPNENVFALYDAGRRWGPYPLHLPDSSQRF